jgi:hypothetical protein
MTHNSNDAPLLARLQWAAKIGLGVSAAAGVGLLLVLFSMPEDAGTSYGSIVATSSLASRNLGTALLIYGLAMVAFAGAFTWLIALYGSFRVAGPIYRFEQNLQRELAQTAAPPVPIRHSDELQAEWQQFRAGVMSLRDLYRDVSAALTAAEGAAASGAAVDGPALPDAVDRLKQVANRVRL